MLFVLLTWLFKDRAEFRDRVAQEAVFDPVKRSARPYCDCEDG